MTGISYDEATAAQKLGAAIIQLGTVAGVITKERAKEGGFALATLLQVLDDVLSVHASAQELVDAAKAVGNGITVDAFWERQGWYFVNINDHSQISQEFTLLNDCVRHIVLHGYMLREVRRTRGTVPQPKPKLPERKPSDAE